MKKKLLSILLMMVLITTSLVGCGNIGVSSEELYNQGQEYYNNGDYENAYDYYVQASKKGNGDAYGMLGNMYYSGTFVEQNFEKAFENYKKAVEHGAGAAFERGVGLAYLYGNGVEKNIEEGLRWVESAAEKGDANANRELGVRYFDGIDVEQDYAKSLYYFEKASEAGEGYCSNQIGYMYMNGIGVEQDYAKGIEYYEKGLEQGNASSANNLGYTYEFGKGVEIDYTKAKEYYEKGVELGNANAMYNLAIMYREGRGTEIAQDYTKAVEYLEMALEKDFGPSANLLGLFYQTGEGVERDFGTAKEYYKKGIELGHAMSAYNLAKFNYKYKDSLEHLLQAIDYFIMAGDMGYPNGYRDVALIYYNGIAPDGVDLELAKEYIQKALDAGYEGDDIEAMKKILNE